MHRIQQNDDADGTPARSRSATSPESQPTALAGVRVLDLCDESGAYCGKLLADMGADVVKIVAPNAEAAREPAPPLDSGSETDGGWSPFDDHYNTGKRCLHLEVNSRAGRTELVELAAAADVVIETYPPGFLERRGLGFPTLASINPSLVMSSITPFGQSGPYRDWRASDLVAQAISGMLYLNGSPKDPPCQGFGLQAYHSAAVFAAIGTVLALRARLVHGRGQFIDVSIQAAAAANVEYRLVQSSQGGTSRRQQTLHWTQTFRVSRCKNGYLLLSSLGDWTALREWVEADLKTACLSNSIWETADYRNQHAKELFDELDRWAARHDNEALFESAQARHLPFAVVRSPRDLPSDPQLLSRNFSFPRPGAIGTETHEYSDAPWRSSHLAPGPNKTAPATIGAETPTRAPRRRAQSSGSAMLEGVRVLDFTWAVAGPVATRILADAGADVLKVERPDVRSADFGPDSLRPAVDRGKRSIVIDMDEPSGRQLAASLIRQCDIVVDNFSPRVMENWGFEDSALRDLRPEVITLSMSAFGKTGPWRDYVAYGPTLQALAGITAAMSTRAGEPAGWGFSYSDMAAAAAGALAVIGAIYRRDTTGQGQCIDLSQFENLVSLLGPIPWAQCFGSQPTTYNGSQERPAAPHGIYRCAGADVDEQWCAIAVFDDDEWQRLCQALGFPADVCARFATYTQRAGATGSVDGEIERRTRQLSAEDVMHRLQRAGVRAGIVCDARDLSDDPQMRQRRSWRNAEGKEQLGNLDGLAFLSSLYPPAPAAPPPKPGEHTDIVLSELLGYDSAAIAQLRRQGALG